MNRFDRELAIAFGDEPDRDVEAAFGATANTANFLDGGDAPIASTVRAPVTDPVQAARDRATIEATRARVLEQQRLTANAAYLQRRAADANIDRAFEARMRTENTPEAAAWRAREKKIKSAGVDWGLIPAGAGVLAAGAAIIATGGALAGAIAAPSAASIAGAAVAADRALAAAEKGKVIGKTGVAGVTSTALAIAGKAQAVLDTTAKLAADGVPAAVNGMKVIAATAARRAAAGALPGVPTALTATGAKAFDQYLAAAPPGLAVALGAATTGRVPALVAQGKPPAVDWFVSAAGKVSRGAKPLGSGWRVYSDGKVIKQ